MKITVELQHKIPRSELKLLFSLWSYNPTSERIEHKIDKLPKNSIIMVGRINSNPIGGLIAIQTKPYFTEIIGLGIIQEKRCQGYGSNLLQKLIDLHPKGVIILQTDDDSIEFYKKQNFIPVQEFRIGDRNRYCLRYASDEMNFQILNYDDTYETELFEIYNESKLQEFIQYPEITRVPRIQDDQNALNSFHKSKKIMALYYNAPIGFIGSVGNYISHLYVVPEFHKLGIGSLLLSEILKADRNDWFLWTTSGNSPAINLYTKGGFGVTEEIDSKYQGFDIKIIKMQQRCSAEF